MAFRNLSRVIIRRFLIFEDVYKYGFWPTMKRLFMLRETWAEKGDKICVGKDKYGNTYWETSAATEVHRNRWVELPGRGKGWTYDASSIPSEWHGWLHYSRDNPPSAEDQEGKTSITPQYLKVQHFASSNSGTRKQYFVPHHIFNPVHTNPEQKPHVTFKRPSAQDFLRENKDYVSRDYQRVPLEELNEERKRI